MIKRTGHKRGEDGQPKKGEKRTIARKPTKMEKRRTKRRWSRVGRWELRTAQRKGRI